MLLNFLLIEFISYPERVTKNENAKKNKKNPKTNPNKQTKNTTTFKSVRLILNKHAIL